MMILGIHWIPSPVARFTAIANLIHDPKYDMVNVVDNMERFFTNFTLI